MSKHAKDRESMWPRYQLANAKLVAVIQAIRDDESGATAVEFGLIAAGIAVANIGVVFMLDDEICAFFANIQQQLASKNSG